MQNVSEDFMNELNKTIRNRTYVEVKFQVIDNKLTSECTTIDNGHTSFSGQTFIGQRPYSTEYATLEEDYWLLDGSKTNLPASNYDPQPIILSPLSDADGNFTGTKPMITVTATDLTQTYSLIGIILKFDELQKDYATSFTIQRYNNGTLVGTNECTNDDVMYISNFNLEDFTEIRIIFNSMNKPYRRVRLSNLVLGTEVKFTEDDIITMTHKKETDVLSREIMENSFEVTIDNYEGQYNADNPTTLNRFLQDYQEIYVDYLQEMDDGSLEKVNGGKYYLDGTPKINKNEATFYATGLVEKMTDTYYRAYEDNGVNYKTLLSDIFMQKLMPDNLGEPSFEIDNSLANMTCTVPIPAYSGNELIQLICNATNMVCYEDVNAKIHIAPNNTIKNDYKYTLNEQYEYPKVTTLAKLKNINVKYYSKTIANSTSEIFSNTYDNLTAGEQTEIVIDYNDPCKGGVATVTGGTLNNAEYYAYGCKLKITPSGTSATIKVNGYEITLKKSVATLKVNETGEDCDIDNPLICTREQALSVANNFKTYLLYRNTYELSTRGNLALDINDVVGLETQFSGEKEPLKGIVMSSKLTYNGAVKSELEIKGTGMFYNYLGSTFTQYIDTGINPAKELKIVAYLELTDTTNQRLFGNHYNSLPCSVSIISGKWQAYIFNETCSSNVVVKKNQIYKVEFYIGATNQYLKIDDEEIIVRNKNIGSNTSSKTILLFKRNSSSSSYNGSYMKLYTCQIHSNTNLVRDFVAIEDSNEVPCLYDKVSKTNFYNAGTGTFLYG